MNILSNVNETPSIVHISSIDECNRILQITGRDQLPLVFIKGDCVGGYYELQKIFESGILIEWIKTHKYNLIVIGGGSGGLAAAKVYNYFDLNNSFECIGSCSSWQIGSMYRFCNTKSTRHKLGFRWNMCQCWMYTEKVDASSSTTRTCNRYCY